MIGHEIETPKVSNIYKTYAALMWNMAQYFCNYSLKYQQYWLCKIAQHHMFRIQVSTDSNIL